MASTTNRLTRGDPAGVSALQPGRLSVAPLAFHALLAVLPALILGAALIAPIVMFASRGLSTVGMTEESTGYRYFYSLRTLYTSDERPWLPQGQIMTVLHLLLQAGLTMVGYPISQLTPRMELFAYLGAGAACIGTALTAYWALRPLASLPAQLAVITVLVCVIFDRTNSSAAHLLAPDYLSWVHAVMMLALGCTLRLAGLRTAPSWRWVVGLGVVAGVAISLKVTLAVFALPPVLLVLFRLRSLVRFVAAGLAIGGISGGMMLAFTWLSNAGDMAATARYFQILIGFAGAIEGASQESFVSWYATHLIGDVGWLSRLSVAVPILVAASAMLLRPRLVSLVFLPALAISVRLLWKRDEPTTSVEVFDFALMTLVVWTACVAAPAVARIVRRRGLAARLMSAPSPLRLAAGALAVAVCLSVLMPVVSISLEAHLDSVTVANALQQSLDRYFVEHPGKVAVFTLDNTHRPITRDSAIFKGGTNVANSNLWGVSPFVAGLVPERHYYFPTAALRIPLDLSSFTSVQFVSLEPLQRLDVMERKLVKAFGVSLMGFDCGFHPVVFGAAYYVCARLPDAPIAEHQGEIGYASSLMALEEGRPTAWRQGPARPLHEGEAAFVGASGEIWRLEPSGSFTRLGGAPGQTVQIGALGNSSRSRTLGAPVVYDGFRWRISQSPTRPINRNPTLQMQADNSLRGWDVLDRERVAVARRGELSDAAAPDGWLRIQVHTAEARAGVRAGFDKDDLSGGPALAVITARAVSTGGLSVRIGNAVAGNAVAVKSSGDDATVHPTRGEWERVVVRVEQEQLMGDRLALLIELADPKPGDRLDIAKAEIFAARYP